ncbi:MAG: tetratricopeptide repeat protein [Psychromonas sp.]|nr:tetratricopeptide repeat protein [Psychromonas sp.]
MKFNKKKTLTAVMLASSVLLSACGESTPPKKAPLSQYTQQGNSYLELFQFKAAITAAKNAVIAYPEHIDGYLILAKIYLQLGQPDASTSVLKAYKSEKNSDYYFLLLESFQKANKLISASNLIATYDDILKKQPNRLKKQQAILLLREKKVEQAFALFKELESTEKYKIDALIGQARAVALTNDNKQSILLLNRAISHDDKNIEALILKSYLLISENNLAEAEKTLSHILTLIPSSDIFTPERITVLQAVTEVLTAQGRSSEALLYSRILADEFPEATSINQYYIEASKQYQNGELGLAKQTLEKILKIAPSYKKSLTLYGVILYKQGDIKGAQKYLSEIVDPENDAAGLTQLYAMTQLKLNNANDVLVMLEDTISTETNYDTLSLYLLAAINQQQGKKAELTLARIEKLFPDNEKSALLTANYYSNVSPADHPKALSVLAQALKTHPENIQLQTAYLKKLISLNKESDVANFIKQLQNSEQFNIDSQLLVASYQLYYKKWQQAEAIFNTVLKQQEDNLIALYGLAQILQQKKSWSEAQSAYRRVILFHPQELKGYQGFIYNQIQLEADINQAEKKLPENYDKAVFSLVLADALLQQNEIQQAKSRVDIASHGLASELLPYLTELQQKISYKRAISALSNKEFAEARKLTLTALQNNQNQPSLLLLLTKIEIESKQLDEASKVLQQVENILPNNPIATIYKAEIALAQGGLSKAIKILEDKWQTDHNDRIAQKLYLILLQQDKQQAEQFLVQWQDKTPQSPSATLSKALQLQKEGDAKGALALYEKVLEQRPNELTSLNNAAWLYSTLNDSRGELLAKRAYSLESENAAIADTYGWILYKSGRVAEAKPLIKKAHRLASSNSEIMKHWQEIKDL